MKCAGDQGIPLSCLRYPPHPSPTEQVKPLQGSPIALALGGLAPDWARHPCPDPRSRVFAIRPQHSAKYKVHTPTPTHLASYTPPPLDFDLTSQKGPATFVPPNKQGPPDTIQWLVESWSFETPQGRVFAGLKANEIVLPDHVSAPGAIMASFPVERDQKRAGANIKTPPIMELPLA